MKTTLAVLALAVALPAGAAEPGGAEAKAAFVRLKALAGNWEGTIQKPDGAPGSVRYEVSAGGSVVEETLFPGAPHEMLTLYHLEGEQLVLTHYCAAGNQPRMRLVSASPQEVKFDFAGAGVKAPAVDGHMHAAAIRFVAEDKIEADWTFYKDGKAVQTEKFFLARKK